MTRFSNCTIATRDYWHARIFATKRTIKILKIPPELAGNKLSGYVSISVLIKCGEWVVYAETVTYYDQFHHPESLIAVGRHGPVVSGSQPNVQSGT